MRWKEKNLRGRSTIIQAQISAEDFYSASKCGNLGTKALGIRYVDHYLDDWITIDSPGSSECEENCALMAATFDRLGCPLAQDKTEDPTRPKWV